MSDFEWDDAKEKCLDLLLEGIPKLKIAAQLGVHRNTINNWTSHPVFMTKANARMSDIRESTTFKRTRQAGVFADVAGKNAMKAAMDLDKDPTSEVQRRRFRDFTAEWRDNTRTEREILGLNVQRIESRVSGNMQHTHVDGTTFKDLLLEAVKGGKKIIDVKAIEKAGNPLLAAQTAMRSLLTANNSEMLDKMHQKDKDDEKTKREEK